MKILDSQNNAEKRIRKNTTVILDGEQVSIDVVFKLIQNVDITPIALQLGLQDIRKLVSSYYQIQDQRIRINNQVFQLQERGVPEIYAMQELLKFFNSYEARVENIMDAWVKLPDNKVAHWLIAIPGIATILSSGLISNIDIEKASTAGAVLRYFGQDPTCKWVTNEEELKALINQAKELHGQKHIDYLILTQVCQYLNRSVEQSKTFLVEKKGYDDLSKISQEDLIKSLKLPPYNQEMKTLCWKIGSCLFKVKKHPNDIYGKLIDDRKAYESVRNQAGLYRDQAAEGAKRVAKNTEAYKWYSQGMLPPGHIQTRACRFAVKIFLSHLHAIMYWHHFQKVPPRPYAMTVLGHKDYIRIPNPEIVDFPEKQYYALGNQIGTPLVP